MVFRGASTKKGLACAAVLVSVSVTACASEGGRPVDALGRSVAATEDAGTANVAITYTERIDSAPGGGGRFIIQSKGSLDFADQSGQVVVNAESNAELEAFEVRYIGAETFVEVPASEAAAVGAKWIRSGPVENIGSEDESSALVAAARIANPEDLLERLENASGESVQEMGDRRYAGEHMTAFRAIIDAGEQLGRWEQTLSSLGIREPEESALGEAFAGVDVTVNVLVDDNDRVRRVDDEISVQQLMEAAIISGAMPPEFVGDARRFKGIITNTVEFSDFGVAVSVTAPAVDETIDVDEAVQRSQTI